MSSKDEENLAVEAKRLKELSEKPEKTYRKVPNDVFNSINQLLMKGVYDDVKLGDAIKILTSFQKSEVI